MLGAWLIGLVAAGCGGDETLTKPQYVSELSAMCEDFSAREKAIGEPTTMAGLVEDGPLVVDAFEQAILDRIRTMEAPDEIEDQADRLVELAEQQRDVLAALVEAAKGGDAARVQELVPRNAAVNKEAASIARELGAEGCTGG
jgi:hypothetical protein